MDIKEKIRALPDSPGIYLMKDKSGEILYVGKASCLRKRVSSYFQKPPAAKTGSLLARLADVDYIQTASSAQALLLENALIKMHKPRYNAALKDSRFKSGSQKQIDGCNCSFDSFAKREPKILFFLSVD